MKTYRVYIVQCNEGSYYTGVTNNLELRLQEHTYSENKNSYTYNRRPVQLVDQEEGGSIQDAIQKEKQIKGRSSRKKELLISGNHDRLKGVR